MPTKRKPRDEDVRIAIVDQTKRQSTVMLRAVAAALQRQVLEHFAPASPRGWGISACVRVASVRYPALPDEWPLYLLPNTAIDVRDALGYHDETKSNLPIMRVFPELDAHDGLSWSVTASHEILETLADPWLGRCIQSDGGRIWALEVCDPVEADTYKIEGIDVSNFVLPSWFEPAKDKATRARAKYDFLGRCSKPFEIREGGYARYLTRVGWKSDTKGSVRAFRKTAGTFGRSAQRKECGLAPE